MRAQLAKVAYWTGNSAATAIAVLALSSVRSYGAVPAGAGLALAGCVWALGVMTQQLLISF